MTDYPDCDPGVEPFGSRVLVQLRTARKKTKGGLLLPDEVRETDQWNTQDAMVRGVGPLAFHNRTTMAPWPEGSWVYVGDLVRVPKYGGDRWTVDLPDGEKAHMVLFNDLDLLGRLT